MSFPSRPRDIFYNCGFGGTGESGSGQLLFRSIFRIGSGVGVGVGVTRSRGKKPGVGVGVGVGAALPRLRNPALNIPNTSLDSRKDGAANGQSAQLTRSVPAARGRIQGGGAAGPKPDFGCQNGGWPLLSKSNSILQGTYTTVSIPIVPPPP